jgi:hypothetical protein
VQELDEEATTILVVHIGSRCHPHWRLQLQAAAAVVAVVHVVVIHVGSCSCSRCVSTEGRLGIRHPKYKALEYLSPEWVTPKYPNAKCENDLLVVIKGEHFGKYTRRIYHRFVDEEPIAILAVVNRVAGQVDTLTGDQLEMDASHLCVCKESIED